MVKARFMLLLLALACRPPVSPRPIEPQVRYRPGTPIDDAGQQLLAIIPDGQWDLGLVEAAEDLMMVMRDRTARIPPTAASLAAARAGFPGQARFARQITGGAFPDALVEQALLSASGLPVDLGLVSRSFGDGITLWVLGWAPHVADIDPLPLRLDLDGSLAVRMDLLTPVDRNSRLFLAPPDSAVMELTIRSGVARWLDRFETPGEWRVEVITGEQQEAQVALLFSVFVDSAPPPLPILSAARLPAPNPSEAEAALYVALQTMRAERGLPRLQRFELFESVAREHSALMASSGVIAHRIPGVTAGVPDRAARLAHPRAAHTENVAAAANAEEAMDLVTGSPAHLGALLCQDCTHVSIGAALEPVLDRRPRLFVTWEMMSFPEGAPRKIRDW
ncbi:MAG: hypothetical protein ACI8RZ_004022 [Myxococcota bacterium]|jgi:uncharacterized protein YkwD